MMFSGIFAYINIYVHTKIDSIRNYYIILNNSDIIIINWYIFGCENCNFSIFIKDEYFSNLWLLGISKS